MITPQVAVRAEPVRCNLASVVADARAMMLTVTPCPGLAVLSFGGIQLHGLNQATRASHNVDGTMFRVCESLVWGWNWVLSTTPQRKRTLLCRSRIMR